MRFAPDSKLPLVLCCKPGSQSAGLPSAQQSQWPQLGTKIIETRCPGFRSLEPEPVLTTSPTASWPKATGVGLGRSPLITDKSECHTPAARIFTSTSSGPGSAKSASTICSGLVSVKGREMPILESNEMRVFTGNSPIFIVFALMSVVTLGQSCR